MKMITLYDAEWKIQRIDNMVKQGLFSSRSDVYRHGSFFMSLVPEARRLAALADTRTSAMKKRFWKALDALEKTDIETLIDALHDLGDAYVIKSFVSSILSEKSAMDYESIKDTIHKSVEVLSGIDRFTDDEQQVILEDLKRDLEGLLDTCEALMPKPTLQEVTLERPITHPYGFGIVKFNLGRITGHGFVQVRPVGKSKRIQVRAPSFEVVWSPIRQYPIAQARSW